jgi:RNA polymerase sigma-70 factor (ECF subfamily)
MSQERSDFASFYEAARDDCLRTVYASVGDLDTAQDMVAEAFVRAWASWRKVSRHPAPRAWVVRTALNAGVSSWRKRRRDQPLLGEDRVAADADGLAVPMGRELLAALQRLPER